MASPEASKAITDTWAKIFDYADKDEKPRGYGVAVPSGESTGCQVFVKPLHGVAAGEPPGDGLVVFPGQRESFFANRAGGSGSITEVWARVSSGSISITHGEIHDEGHPS